MASSTSQLATGRFPPSCTTTAPRRTRDRYLDTLAAELDRLARPHRMQIYPPFGTGAIGQEGHNMCGPRGAPVWSADVFDFIGGVLAQSP